MQHEDVHELYSLGETSLPCSIKESLRERMNHSKRFVLIVGKHTDAVAEGGFQFCHGYNSWTKRCAKGHPVDYRSFVRFECHLALRAGIDIVTLYNSTRVDRSKCPEPVRPEGRSAAMIYYEDGSFYWDCQAVKH